MNYQTSNFIFHDADIDFYDGQQHPLYITVEESTVSECAFIDIEDFNAIKREPLIKETLLVYPVAECPVLINGQCKVLNVTFNDVVSFEYRALNPMLVIRRRLEV